MASIGSLGVGSGLDLETLVTKLISAEGTPRLSSLASKEASIQADISAFGTLKSALDKFRTTAKSLSDAEALRGRTVSTGNSKQFSASANGNAVAGRYSVQVLNTARAQKLVSTADFASGSDTVGAGTLTITVGSDSFEVTTTATTTLAELKTLINDAADNAGLSASLMVVARDPLDASAGTVARLVLAADETGAENTIGITVSDADTNGTDNLGLSRFYYSATDTVNSQLDEQQAAANARIVVDGLTAFSTSNVFSNVIDGVTLTALKDPSDPLNPEVETMDIGLDRNGVAARISAFVASYNELVGAIRDVSSYDAEAGTAGALNGDATVRGISSRLRTIIGASGIGDGTLRSLAELGIQTQRDGTLKLDSAKLDTALRQNFADVSALFASSDGIGTRLESMLDGFLDGDGVLATRTAGLGQQLKAIDTEREKLGIRLEKLETQYRARFSALDALVAQLQSSGEYLLAQLENTASIIGRTPGGGN
jgi:flagellar hook-associated protein 2